MSRRDSKPPADPRPSRRAAARWCAQVALGLGLAVAASSLTDDQDASAQPPPDPLDPGVAEQQLSPDPPFEPTAVEGRDSRLAYRMTVQLDPAEHQLKGEGTITWRNASAKEQQEIWLHLYLNAFKNERTVFMRSTQTRGFRGGETPEQWGWIEVERFEGQGKDLWPGAAKHSPGDEADLTDIRVPLAEPVAPGEEVTFTMAWKAQLPSVVARTGFAERFHMVAQWFPKLAKLEPDGTWVHFPFHRLSEFYADFASYEVTIDVPEGYTVGATGPMTKDGWADGRRQFTHRVERVHDFAFTAWDGFEEHLATAPTGVAMRALVPKGEGDLAALELELAGYGLEDLGERFGAYPYDVLTIVHPPRNAREAGGMEYPTLITTGGSWTRPLLGMRSIESVTIHELAHQWFYGMLASNEHEYPFLDEGLTTWAQQISMAKRWPDKNSAFAGARWALGWTIDHASFNRAGAALVAGRDAVSRSTRDFANGQDYGGLVYARTSTLLETLHRLHPEGMARAMKIYASRHRFGHPEPPDLILAVEEELGEKVGEAMRLTLLKRGTLDYAVDSMWSEEAKDAKGIFGDPASPTAAPKPEAAHRGAVIVRRRGSVVLPVEIELHAEDGSVQVVAWDGEGPHHTIAYAGDSPLAAVIIDPQHKLLLDGNLANNVARRSPGRMAWRTWAHLSLLSHNLMHLVAP